jgi:hypothetical protein
LHDYTKSCVDSKKSNSEVISLQLKGNTTDQLQQECKGLSDTTSNPYISPVTKPVEYTETGDTFHKAESVQNSHQSMATKPFITVNIDTVKNNSSQLDREHQGATIHRSLSRNHGVETNQVIHEPEETSKTSCKKRHDNNSPSMTESRLEFCSLSSSHQRAEQFESERQCTDYPLHKVEVKQQLLNQSKNHAGLCSNTHKYSIHDSVQDIPCCSAMNSSNIVHSSQEGHRSPPKASFSAHKFAPTMSTPLSDHVDVFEMGNKFNSAKITKPYPQLSVPRRQRPNQQMQQQKLAPTISAASILDLYIRKCNQEDKDKSKEHERVYGELQIKYCELQSRNSRLEDIVKKEQEINQNRKLELDSLTKKTVMYETTIRKMRKFMDGIGNDLQKLQMVRQQLERRISELSEEPKEYRANVENIMSEMEAFRSKQVQKHQEIRETLQNSAKTIQEQKEHILLLEEQMRSNEKEKALLKNDLAQLQTETCTSNNNQVAQRKYIDVQIEQLSQKLEVIVAGLHRIENANGSTDTQKSIQDDVQDLQLQTRLSDQDFERIGKFLQNMNSAFASKLADAVCITQTIASDLTAARQIMGTRFDMLDEHLFTAKISWKENSSLRDLRTSLQHTLSEEKIISSECKIRLEEAQTRETLLNSRVAQLDKELSDLRASLREEKETSGCAKRLESENSSLQAELGKYKFDLADLRAKFVSNGGCDQGGNTTISKLKSELEDKTQTIEQLQNIVNDGENQVGHRSLQY